jgi:HSP20 family protein
MMPRSGLRPRLTLEEDGGVGVGWSPSAGISETDKEYVVRAELPGMRKEDVKVMLANGVLTIEGERKQEKEREERYYRVENCYGAFSRAFSLPDNIKSDAIRCESKDGVLTLHVPKTERSKPKEITIQ